MAASMARRRGSARRNAAIRAKERRTRIVAAVLGLLLAALLAFQLPKVLGRSTPSSSAAPAAPGTPGTGPVTPRKLPAILRGAGNGSDPFGARGVGDLDPGIAAGGGRDPFAARLSGAGAVSTPAAPSRLPQRIVIGTPGAHKHLVHGWIVILASIPVGRGHGSAARFARGVHGLGSISILNSSNRRPLRGGYWVVYAGPVKTLGAVSRLASSVHSAGYRTAYIRELYRYR
jgi:hypothetical protein